MKPEPRPDWQPPLEHGVVSRERGIEHCRALRAILVGRKGEQ